MFQDITKANTPKKSQKFRINSNDIFEKQSKNDQKQDYKIEIQDKNGYFYCDILFAITSVDHCEKNKNKKFDDMFTLKLDSCRNCDKNLKKIKTFKLSEIESKRNEFFQ